MATGATTAARMSEKALQQAVMDCARTLGWEAYHVHDARRSEPGYPDCCFCRPPRLIFAELKVGRNRLTPAQERWLGRLGGVPCVEVYVWRERAWTDGEVERVLR